MTTQTIPGPKGHFLVGSLPEFNVDQPQFLLDLAQTYGDIAHVRLANKHIYLLTHPAYIRQVLITDQGKFIKADLDRAVLGKFLGNGLLTSEGEFHRRQRHLAQPAFHSKRINTYASIMVGYTEQLLENWMDGEQRDITHDMMRLTMQIVSKTLFDAEAITGKEDTAEIVGQAVHALQTASNNDFSRGFLLPDWLPTANNRMRRQAIAVFDEIVEAIIAQRRATAVNGEVADKGDLLSMLMLAKDEEGSTMDDSQLRDEVATLFAAGHETTSNALSWAWYLLSQNPDAEAKLHAELDEVLHGRSPNLDDLPNLPYTLQVIKETLRLYPPAWIINGRTPLEDVDMGPYTIPEGSIIFISPYVMGRLPHYFPEPERFLPERFTPEQEKALPRYVYMPFGAGPRICIGNAFALMEAQLILATIAQRYRLIWQSDHQVARNPQITMSPKGGLPMVVRSRSFG